jgi:hypothetical protein
MVKMDEEYHAKQKVEEIEKANKQARAHNTYPFPDDK